MFNRCNFYTCIKWQKNGKCKKFVKIRFSWLNLSIHPSLVVSEWIKDLHKIWMVFTLPTSPSQGSEDSLTLIDWKLPLKDFQTLFSTLVQGGVNPKHIILMLNHMEKVSESFSRRKSSLLVRRKKKKLRNFTWSVQSCHKRQVNRFNYFSNEKFYLTRFFSVETFLITLWNKRKHKKSIFTEFIESFLLILMISGLATL